MVCATRGRRPRTERTVPIVKRAHVIVLGLALAGAACGSTSSSLGVPHEDPEPIGSAPWETEGAGPSDDDTKGGPVGTNDGAGRVERRARKGKHPKPLSSAVPSASAAPPVAPAKIDTDGDGVEDARDACPREKGADDANPAWAGCPYDAPPRPTPHLFEDLDLVFGDKPRPLDATETETVRGLGDNLKGEAVVALSAYARKEGVARGWLDIVKKTLVDGGIDPKRITTQVCLVPSGLTHTVMSREKKECGGH